MKEIIVKLQQELDSIDANDKDILLPNCSNGKMRVPEAEVIREVPLEDCGLYGKILMARR